MSYYNNSEFYTDLYVRIKEKVFRMLENLSASDFVYELKSTLYYMWAKKLITDKTFMEIRGTLALDKVWSYMRQNQDGTVTCYVDKEYWDTIDISQLTAWIIKKILTDELFSKENRRHDFDGFKRVLECEKISALWDAIYACIKKLKKPKFELADIYCICEDYPGVTSLQVIPYNNEFDDLVNTEIRTVIFDGIDGEFYCVEDNMGLYFSVYGIDAFVYIWEEMGVMEQVYNAQLVDVSESGMAWYIDREGVLKSWNSGNTKECGYVEYGAEFKARQEFLIVIPGKDELEFFCPYSVRCDGVKQKYEKYFCTKLLWERLAESLTCRKKLFEGTENFSDELLAEKIKYMPNPFTIENIIKKLDGLIEEELVDTMKADALKAVFGILVKNGIKPDKDITDVMYNLCRYQRLCTENYRGSSITDKAFYDILCGLDRCVDFAVLLKENPEVLFEKSIYWTSERKSRYISEKRYKERFKERGKIGSFTINDDEEIVADLDYIYNGKIMEDVIAKEERPYKGIVYYDRTLKKYVVLWDEEESEFEHLDELKKLIGSDEVVYVCES